MSSGFLGGLRNLQLKCRRVPPRSQTLRPRRQASLRKRRRATLRRHRRSPHRPRLRERRQRFLQPRLRPQSQKCAEPSLCAQKISQKRAALPTRLRRNQPDRTVSLFGRLKEPTSKLPWTMKKEIPLSNVGFRRLTALWSLAVSIFPCAFSIVTPFKSRKMARRSKTTTTT